MDFPNLFTGLPVFGEDVRSQDRSDVINWNQTNDGKRGRKRKTQTEQPGSYNKRRCYQPKADTTFDASKNHNTEAKFDQKHDSGREHKLKGQTKEKINYNGHKSGSKTRLHQGQKNQTKNDSNVRKQQHRGKMKEKNHQQQHNNNRGRCDYKGGRPMPRRGGGTSRDIRQDTWVNMSDRFMEQNAMLVDGQLLCRHFLWGRCIKADDCQLKHLQPHNDMIKEVCKYYVQGSCIKGESCPYMHKSFPCKFFHRYRKCTQDMDCKFSHDPLSEVTERLLNEMIKRAKDLHELAKPKEESTVRPGPSEESDITEADGNHDEILQPLRPSFYYSSGAEKVSSVHQPEELADNKDEPHSPPSTGCTQAEPVCYSVEALLGPQQSRSFPSFFTTHESQETKPVSAGPQVASDSTLGSTDQSEVPYSVDAVLRSYKPIGQTSSPPRAQTVSYAPKTTSQNLNKVLLRTMGRADLPKEKTYKGLTSLQGHPSLISNTYPDVYLASGDHKNRGDGTSQCQQDAQITSHEGKLRLLSSPVTEPETSASSPPELKPNLSGLTSDTQTFRKPFSPSLDAKDCKGAAAAAAVEPVTSSIMSANAAVHHFAVKQFTEIHLNPRRTRPTLKRSTLERNSAKIPPQRPDKMSMDGHFSVGCNKTQVKTVKPASDSVTAPACPQDVIKSQQPADVTEKTPASSFLSLFAVPLGEIPASSPCLPFQTDQSSTPSCSQQSVKNTSSNLKPKGSGLETSVQLQARTDAKQTSNSSASSKFSCKNGNDPEKQKVTPVCRPASNSSNDLSRSGTQQQQPDVSSPRDLPADTSSDSVLKTLFLSLEPYQEDREQHGRNQNIVCSEGEKEDSTTSGLKQQQESRRRNKLKKDTDSTTLTYHKQSTEKTNEKAKESAEHQLSFQTTSEAAGPSTIGQRGLTKSPVRTSGTHSFPFRAVTPVTKSQTQLRETPTSEEGGKTTANPFKDLFKTLDMSVFSSGH